MKYAISNVSRSRVYHREECRYIRMMKPYHRKWIDDMAVAEGLFCPCKCCIEKIDGQKKPWHNPASYNQIKKYGEYEYDRKRGIHYLRTEVGFWKICEKRNGMLALYHLNCYDKDKSFNELKGGAFHRQKDCAHTKKLVSLIRYASEHDKAKALCGNDYHRLPRTTKKQKQYYRAAKNREKRRSIRRVEEIFAELEAERALNDGKEQNIRIM